MQVLPEENFLLEMAGLPMPILGVKGKTAVVGGVCREEKEEEKENHGHRYHFHCGRRKKRQRAEPMTQNSLSPLSPWPEGLSPSWAAKVGTAVEG